MPNYKGHLVGGFLAYVLVLFAYIGYMPSLVTGCEWLLFALAGALFPDIDIKSKGQKYFYYVVFILFAFLASKGHFQTLTCFSFVAIAPMLTRHRGVFHSTWFVVSVPLIAWMAMSILLPAYTWPLFVNTLFFIAGALSHLFLDRYFTQMSRKNNRW